MTNNFRLMNKNLRTLTVMAVLSALAVVLSYLEIPLPFFAFWIKLDFANVPALMAAFAFGPLAGVGVLAITNIFHAILRGATNGIGELANFIMGAALILPAGLIYKRDYNLRHTRLGAWVGSGAGTVVSVVTALVTNVYVLIPLYSRLFHIDIDQIGFLFGTGGMTGYLLAASLPFNLLKSLLTCGVMLVAYKPLSPILHGRSRR